MVILAIFGTFFILAAIGVPIAIALAMGAVVPLHFFTNTNLVAIVQRFFTAIDSYGLMAVPLFMIAGGLLDKGGVSKRLVDFANSLVGWLPGGLAVVAFLASAFFGAISGSSVATVAAIGSIMVPSMLKEGYPLDFSLATVASAGWLGIIVPPSIPMVIYGISSGESVGELFLGGFIPGFLLAGGMAVYALIYGCRNLKTTRKFQMAEVARTFKAAIWALGMPLIVLGGIYGGIFTPTEAAAVSIFYGFMVGAFIYRELSLKLCYQIMKISSVTSAMILFVVATATAFGYVMTMNLIPVKVANFIMSVAGGTGSFLLLVTILLLIVGTFMDTVPAILILTPILTPMLETYNVNPVAFGIIMTINLGIGLITPPVGLNLYVAAGIQKVPVTRVINRHLLIYMMFALALLIVFMAFPQIIMLLPQLMK